MNRMTCTNEYPLCRDCGKKFLPNPKIKNGDKFCNICRFLLEIAASDFKRLVIK